jgi:hypothetical protein
MLLAEGKQQNVYKEWAHAYLGKKRAKIGLILKPYWKWMGDWVGSVPSIVILLFTPTFSRCDNVAKLCLCDEDHENEWEKH